MTDFLQDQMEADFASSIENTALGSLTGIAKIARTIRTTQEEVQELETKLKARKKDLLKLTDEDLPSAMQEMGLSSFALDDGATVDVKPTYGASIPVNAGRNHPLWYTKGFCTRKSRSW